MGAAAVRSRVTDLSSAGLAGLLGDYTFDLEYPTFQTTTTGDLAAFSRSKWHEIDGNTVYRFDLHSGIVTS